MTIFLMHKPYGDPTRTSLLHVPLGQFKKESGIDLPTMLPVRVGDEEEVMYEVATVAVRKALRLNRAIQASHGHWLAENAGPMFFTPPLVNISFHFLRNLLRINKFIFFVVW